MSYYNGSFSSHFASVNRSGGIPIAFDSGGRTENATGSSATASVTIGNTANRLLLVAVGFSDATDTVSTVVLGAQSLTKALAQNNLPVASTLSTEIWYLIAPTVGAGTITVTFTGSVSLPSIGYLSVYNCNQTTGVQTATGNSGTAANSGVTITPTATGSWIFGAFTPNAIPSAVSDTQVWLSTDGSHYMEAGCSNQPQQ